jgi:hypothetical protein
MDWQLPTKRELNHMYVERQSIGAMSYYWSSTEDDNDDALIQDFFG